MIKAYHQIGTDAWEASELEEGFNAVLSQGQIEPAISRLDRQEMETECFDPQREAGLKDRFPRATRNARTALREIAEEKIRTLPESGFVESMFNCLDLIAGDLELVFLKPNTWYSVDNGFVFDAEQLLMMGARFRKTDLLGIYHAAIEETVKVKFISVKIAKKVIKSELHDVHEYLESTGQAAIQSMEDGLTDRSEIVWPGDLPLSLAVEAWRNGKRMR